jgi:hypothetical protein
MHIGHNNAKEKYRINGHILQDVTEERDLGVIIQNDLKCNKQCVKAVKASNKMLGMIKRTFSYLTQPVFIHLYKSMVRPRLEYCVQAWRPHFQKDIDLIENVQRRATKLIPGLKEKPYEERLKCLNLTTLETRRLRGDLIEAFKIMKGLQNVEPSTFFKITASQTRGHALKLFKPTCRLDIRKYGFSHRVITEWNRLSTDDIACDTVNSFKIE